MFKKGINDPANEKNVQKKDSQSESKHDPIKKHSLETNEGASLVAKGELPAVMTSRFGELRQSVNKLPIYVEISKGMWTDELKSKYSKALPLSILNSEYEHGALINKLRAGGTIEEIERGTAVAYLSLVTGWLMDDVNKQDIYLLLTNSMGEADISTGDVMLAIIIKETAKMSSPGKELSRKQMQEWLKLAKSKNPLIRQISAYILPNLTASLEDQSNFFLEYGNESELEIVKTIATTIQRMPKSKANVLITNLANLQQKAGNLQGSLYLQSLLAAGK